MAAMPDTAPTRTDNCAVATFGMTSGVAVGGNFPVGHTTTVYQVTDSSGNQATCNFNITIVDAEAPAISAFFILLCLYVMNYL